MIAASPPNGPRQPERETVGAAMAAEEGHGMGAVVRQREHRRFGDLVAQQRRERAYEYSRRAYADDGRPSVEKRCETVAEVVEDLVGAVHAAREAVDARAFERRGGAARRGHAAGAENDDGGGGRL